MAGILTQPLSNLLFTLNKFVIHACTHLKSCKDFLLGRKVEVGIPNFLMEADWILH